MENEKRLCELLEERIRSEIKGLENLKPGSQEKSTAVDDLCALYKLMIEEEKVDLEVTAQQDKKFDLDMESDFRNKQLSEQKRDRYFRTIVACAEIVVPIVFYGIWMRRGFKFEENGTFTSTTFRSLFNRFKPTK